MAGQYTEARLVEAPTLELFVGLGWTVVNAFGEAFGEKGTLGRDNMRDVFLVHRLRASILRLNPQVPEVIRDEALNAIVKDRSLTAPIRGNHDVYDLIRNGYRAEWQGERGDREYATVQFIDFRDPTANDLLAASQVWIAGDLYRRRADALLFVNGIPLVLLEFKEPNRPVKAAYDENLTDYRDTIPQLFVPNGFVLLSNGSEAKVGLDLCAVGVLRRLEGYRRGRYPARRGARRLVALETAIRGTCAPDKLLDLIENFVAFMRAARRSDQGRGPQSSSPRRQRRDRDTSTRSGRLRISGSGCSGIPRVLGNRCRCCGLPRRCCARSLGRGRS